MREGRTVMVTATEDRTSAKGWESLKQEVVLDDVPVEGTLPGWLEGTLVRNGPADYDHGERHWFDGLAMLHRFGIHRGRGSYANRLPPTTASAAAPERRIRHREY